MRAGFSGYVVVSWNKRAVTGDLYISQVSYSWWMWIKERGKERMRGKMMECDEYGQCEDVN